MAMVRAQKLFPAVVLGALLCGCGSVGRYDAAPSHAVDLSGNWTLNHAASDDPKPALEKLRPKPVTHRWDSPPDDDDTNGPPNGGGDQGGQRGGRSRRGGQQGQQQFAYRNNNDAYTHGMVMKMLTADLARADNLTIHQSPDEMSLDYGSMVRRFTPGSKSVVSAAWGVADQSSGWKGKEFVIQVRPQQGVATTETFSLSNDGKHLMEDLQMGGGEYPTVKLKRVYDQSDHPVQRAAPLND